VERGGMSASRPWTAEIVAERLANAATTLARSRATGVAPSGLRSAWPSIAPTEDDRRLAYGYNAAQAPRMLPSAAEVTALDQVLGWVARYLSVDALTHASLPADAGKLAWMRASGHSFAKIATTRARWWPGPPPGGNSREAVRVVCGRACDLVATGLNRDRIPLHVGAVDAPPEADPILTDRREAMPRVMDARRQVMNRWPCGACRHIAKGEDGLTTCRTRGGAVAASMRAQHPEGEPCFEAKAAA